ncbi:MAG TPA: SMP-30/gluconolactonase/LRE family protein [Micromonosporaceae bacterium]
MEIFDSRASGLAEAPWYDERTGRVGWVDIVGARVLWRDLGTGATGEQATSDQVSAAVPRSNGGLVLLLATGPVLADPDWALTPLEPYDDPEPGVAVRTNDAKADPAGRLWFGTMARDHTSPRGALYRLDPGETAARRMVSGVTISNGLGWSGQRMYYVDTPTNRVDIFDYDETTGQIEGRRPFVEVPKPDGLCVDAQGCVWVAVWGSGTLRRYTPDGEIDRELRLPTPQVTSCAFAGPDYRMLVITTGAEFGTLGEPGAGQVYVERLADVAGRPVDRFAG